MAFKIFLTSIVMYLILYIISEGDKKLMDNYFISLAGVSSLIVMIMSALFCIWQ